MKQQEWEIARRLLRDSGLSITDAARLVLELIEESAVKMPRKRKDMLQKCREVIRLGSAEHKQKRRSVALERGVAALLEKKKTARHRTQKEIRLICGRFMRAEEGLSRMMMREISAKTCRRVVEKTFRTAPTKRKAKNILHALFKFGIDNGWCTENPMRFVDVPPYVERRICALSMEQIKALLRTAERKEHAPCAAALGLMLWAGIRPNEVERLKMSHIDFEDKVITIPATHSKTGGARQVTMHPPLMHWLKKHLTDEKQDTKIVPRSWQPRWARLRHAAGFAHWEPDALRHTFASYHLKYFRDLQQLQVEMGHSSLTLLRTRYLAMEGVTSKGAAQFWKYGLRTPATPADRA